MHTENRTNKTKHIKKGHTNAENDYQKKCTSEETEFPNLCFTASHSQHAQITKTTQNDPGRDDCALRTFLIKLSKTSY